MRASHGHRPALQKSKHRALTFPLLWAFSELIILSLIWICDCAITARKLHFMSIKTTHQVELSDRTVSTFLGMKMMQVNAAGSFLWHHITAETMGGFSVTVCGVLNWLSGLWCSPRFYPGPLMFSLYMLPLGQIISPCKHFYADDTQLSTLNILPKLDGD